MLFWGFLMLVQNNFRVFAPILNINMFLIGFSKCSMLFWGFFMLVQNNLRVFASILNIKIFLIDCLHLVTTGQNLTPKS